MAPTTSYKCQTSGSLLDLSLKPMPKSKSNPLWFISSFGLYPGSISIISSLDLCPQSLSTAPLDNQREPVMTPESDHTKAKVLHSYQFTWADSLFGQSCCSQTVSLTAPPISISGMLQLQGLCAGCGPLPGILPQVPQALTPLFQFSAQMSPQRKVPDYSYFNPHPTSHSTILLTLLYFFHDIYQHLTYEVYLLPMCVEICLPTRMSSP